MDGRFAASEEMMKKMLEDKQKTATLETTGNHGSGRNPNPFRGRENPEVEVLEGEDGMPPLELLSREGMSQAYDRRGAEFEGRREEIPRMAVDFEGRRRDYDEGFDYGSSFSDVVQGLEQVLESLGSHHSVMPSSFKYKDNLEKQLNLTTLHVLGFVSLEDGLVLKDFLLKFSF
ncbi:hypothetical protein M5K25_001792 [Dendrobium thyrsiflorum]|uniref:Uncharacterized protein n=1 Tax=Dendrobium thyrsiflorum TaxID=117978 RepID=A0ABD0VRC4_DENTH